MEPPEDKKRPAKTRTRRSRENHGKTATGKETRDRFIEAFTTDGVTKGKITRAAQKAYPNQKRTSARISGSLLLKDSYVQDQIRQRQAACAQMAGITRNDLIGNLVATIYVSLDDVMDETGERIDWQKAKDRGIAHLVQEVEVTERHSKDGGSRTTTRYKLPSKLHAQDLLSELTGWKKAPARNPIDVARDLFLNFRQKAQYADVPDEKLMEIAARAVNVNPAEMMIHLQLPA